MEVLRLKHAKKSCENPFLVSFSFSKWKVTQGFQLRLESTQKLRSRGGHACSRLGKTTIEKQPPNWQTNKPTTHKQTKNKQRKKQRATKKKINQPTIIHTIKTTKNEYNYHTFTFTVTNYSLVSSSGTVRGTEEDRRVRFSPGRYDLYTPVMYR